MTDESYDKMIENISALTEKALKNNPAAALGARFEIKNSKQGVEFSVSANVPEVTADLYQRFREYLLAKKIIKKYGLKL